MAIGPDAEFLTIGEALEASKRLTGEVVFTLAPGEYREKLRIERPDCTFRGTSPYSTTIVYGDFASQKQGGKILGTASSASVTVAAPRFKAQNLTFANDFDYFAHWDLVKDNPGMKTGLQAVAFMTTALADDTHLSGCRFLGYQDTLYLDEGSHVLKDCYIEGSIDFIFGKGKSLFCDCSILSKASGYVCAPSTFENSLGFLFYKCRFLSEVDQVLPRSVFIGRPWHPKAAPPIVSYAGLIDCFLDEHINKEGWTFMHANCLDGTQVFFTPKQSRFFESGSTGPGAVAFPGENRVFLDEKQRAETLKEFEVS